MKAISLLSAFILVSACSSQNPTEVKSVSDSLLSKRDEFRSCYLESESYGGRNEVTEGKVQVNFTISPDGTPTNGKIASSDFKDASLHACLLEQLRGIKFAKPTNGIPTEVSQQLNLSRRDS
jgi:hypothetical protein